MVEWMVGWLGGWLEKMKIEQSSASAGLKLAELCNIHQFKSCIGSSEINFIYS